MPDFTSLELCAGAGGQALGLEQAGVDHIALVELDGEACRTLKLNRPAWPVIRADLNTFHAHKLRNQVDIVAGGLPCPPFSVAGKQLGKHDERNLFPAAFDIIDAVRPKAVMIENVRGLLDAVFVDYRQFVEKQLRKLDYEPDWKLLNACEFGVSQLRPRVVFVAVHRRYPKFEWPEPSKERPPSVGKKLYDLMKANGWQGAAQWRERAGEIAPTIVGGSKKHGGPDLGPTRAKRAWRSLGVNGLIIANDAPPAGFFGDPPLTVRMVARLQGFPDTWQFSGRKTSAYRQVGNAFPPPVAASVAERIVTCLKTRKSLVRVG
jgi:DNA (cytosine-5)-methyltransferase 1